MVYQLKALYSLISGVTPTWGFLRVGERAVEARVGRVSRVFGQLWRYLGGRGRGLGMGGAEIYGVKQFSMQKNVKNISLKCKRYTPLNFRKDFRKFFLM